MNKLQRVFTRSRFDHVALILKDCTNEIFILEATVSIGVSAFSWDNFVQKKGYNLFDKIVYRHLHFNKTADSLLKLRKFITVFLIFFAKQKIGSYRKKIWIIIIKII